MRSFEPVTIAVNGAEVAVAAVAFMQPNGVPALRVTATVGETSVVATHTLGPVDGAHAAPDATHVQAAPGETRLRAARQAAHQEELRRQIAAAK